MIRIPAKAVGKERPRYSSWTKSMYTPKKTKDFEALVASYYAIYMRDNSIETTEGPVSVSLVVYNKVPTAWNKKKRLEALSGKIRPMKTPDGDNILKAVLDGLQSVAYVNDKQVVKFDFDRFYDEKDYFKIDIKHL